MKPVQFKDANAVFSVVENGEAVPDSELPLLSQSGPEGVTLTSVWELDSEEREAVALGANIELRTWGSKTPPVSLAVSAREVVREVVAEQ